MSNRKKVLWIILILVFAFGGAALLTSCSSYRYGCGDARYFSGYGPGGWGRHRTGEK